MRCAETLNMYFCQSRGTRVNMAHITDISLILQKFVGTSWNGTKTVWSALKRQKEKAAKYINMREKKAF